MWPLFAILLLIVLVFYFRNRLRKQPIQALPESSVELLQENVRFYQKLSPEQKKQFEVRVLDFLSTTRISGIGTDVTELDRMLVAASAIIPLFAFPDWRYNNLNEVILYKGTFNKDYQIEGGERDILGMVGDGAMHREMILSQQALRSGFLYDDARNTGIHEFVHLLDKADGATDGIPEYMLEQPYVIPWVQLMHRQIKEIRENHSEIDQYAGANDAEFFAVVAEYFFEKPEQLKAHHPDLYKLLEQIFRQ